MSKLDWKGLLDHLIIVEGECMEENYGKGRASNEMDEECNAGIRKAYAQLVKVQPVLMAAPELLAALKLCKQALKNYIDSGYDEDEDQEAYAAAMAAINKAEGGDA
jgi:hypothetical protein